MATQTVIPAPPAVYSERIAPPAAAPPRERTPSPRLKNLRGTLYLLAFFAVLAAVEAVIPKLRHLLWILPYSLVPALFTGLLSYLREFHPAVMPGVLAYDAPLRLKLKRIRRALGWTAFLTTLAGAAALYASTFTNSCTCEDHPILFITWLATDMLAYLGFLGLSAYLQVRSEPPASPFRRSPSSRNWSAARSAIADSKPLQSDHWGNRGPLAQ